MLRDIIKEGGGWQGMRRTSCLVSNGALGDKRKKTNNGKRTEGKMLMHERIRSKVTVTCSLGIMGAVICPREQHRQSLFSSFVGDFGTNKEKRDSPYEVGLKKRDHWLFTLSLLVKTPWLLELIYVTDFLPSYKGCSECYNDNFHVKLLFERLFNIAELSGTFTVIHSFLSNNG